MKNIMVAVVFAWVVAGPVLAHSSKASFASLMDADTFRQLCRNWADRSVAVDVNRSIRSWPMLGEASERPA